MNDEDLKTFDPILGKPKSKFDEKLRIGGAVVGGFFSCYPALPISLAEGAVQKITGSKEQGRPFTANFIQGGARIGASIASHLPGAIISKITSGMVDRTIHHHDNS